MSALVGVVSMEAGVSFAARRERYTSGSSPFSRLRVPGRLLMYHDSMKQCDYKTFCTTDECSCIAAEVFGIKNVY